MRKKKGKELYVLAAKYPPILYSMRPMPYSEDARHVLITPTANLSSTCRGGESGFTSYSFAGNINAKYPSFLTKLNYGILEFLVSLIQNPKSVNLYHMKFKVTSIVP
ncbi:hypothetical protein NQ318_000679 [Aromia moschata]|uniref:Uncharacterized protein n=1 Tax=Aromia moschata TaxID=1265417 RepID=A0AAV8XXI5_9CUCU|nr:hypothetical protein NQ318_000679 [Aromia moschata]